jgi:hypothetical protein
MNVNELVENYCQITGRPAFTITVDEYIKFHQVARFNAPKEIVYTNEVEVQKKEKKEKKEVIEEVKPTSKKEEVSLSSLAKPKMEREGELKPLAKTSVETKTEKKPTVSALDMLKSIQG